MPNNAPFPSKEADRNQYYINGVAYLVISGNVTRLKITTGNVTALNNGLAAWNTAYTAANAPATRTSITIANKDTEDENMQTLLRSVYADFPTSAMNNTDRETLNIKERDTHGTPSPVPTTTPIGQIDTAGRLQHTISFKDSATPNSKAKPHGVRGCQIWEKIGTPAPVDASELQYVATDTKTPYVNTFDGADAGKVVFYWLRWENTRGEVGPWSPMVGATIGA